MPIGDGKDIRDYMGALLESRAVRAVLDFIKQDHERTVAEQCEIALLEAPPLEEGRRAALLAEKFKSAGLELVRVDENGNAVSLKPGVLKGGAVLMEAHLDTVFPMGSVSGITHDGEKIMAPGIGDNCRGLAAMMSVIRALAASKLEFQRDVVFAATSGEEGIGDLKGVRGLFVPSADYTCSISIDGHGTGDFVFDATGSRRYEVIFDGPGGHSWADFGTASAIHAMGRAVAHISEISVPAQPKTTFNVGLASGGTSVNAIAQEAKMTVDLRSEAPKELDRIEALFVGAVEAACQEEMRASGGKSQIKATFRKIGDRPAGRQGMESSLRSVAIASSELLGITFSDTGSSSTSANIPISMGIPSLCMGGGGEGGGTHTMQEWFTPTDAYKAVQQAALILIACAGIR